MVWSFAPTCTSNWLFTSHVYKCTHHTIYYKNTLDFGKKSVDFSGKKIITIDLLTTTAVSNICLAFALMPNSLFVFV